MPFQDGYWKAVCKSLRSCSLRCFLFSTSRQAQHCQICETIVDSGMVHRSHWIITTNTYPAFTTYKYYPEYVTMNNLIFISTLWGGLWLPPPFYRRAHRGTKNVRIARSHIATTWLKQNPNPGSSVLALNLKLTTYPLYCLQKLVPCPLWWYVLHSSRFYSLQALFLHFL